MTFPSYFSWTNINNRNHRPWIDLRDAHVASYILSVAERGYTVNSFSESVNSLENSTVRNQDGRIIKVKLDYDMEDTTATLPSEIQRLDKLQFLELWGCKQLPIEIGNLSNLISCKLIRCFGLQSLPSTYDMNSLGYLSINSLSRLDFAILMPQIARLPHLEVLALNYVGFNSNDIDDLLLVNQNRFQNSLIELNLYGNEVDQQGLEHLLGKVLPRFMKLAKIDLGRNRISSLDIDVDNDNDTTACSSQLEQLHLKYNPIWQNASSQSQKILIQILKRHPKLGWLGDNFEETSSLCTPIVLHHLDLNRCGRTLICQNYRDKRKRQNQTVPDSVWPIILERANRILGDTTTNTHMNNREAVSRTANALYYLISNGPAFANRKGHRFDFARDIFNLQHSSDRNGREMNFQSNQKCFNEKSVKDKFFSSAKGVQKRQRYC